MKLFTWRKRLEEYEIMSLETLDYKQQIINSLTEA